MGLLDDIMGAKPENATQPKPEKGKFSRAGYFDWEKKEFLQEKDVAIGVILPPYKTWLAERIAAVKSGTPFTKPFMVAHGHHGVGTSQRDKAYAPCRRTLVRENKVGDGYPLITKAVLDGGDACPLCDVAWNELWPKVQEYQGNKDSPEYKAYKAAHKAACPQVKYLVNFLPMGHTVPVILDMAKTLAEVLTNIHYDKYQPDLLWPYSTQNWQSAWLQIRRLPQADGNPTKYTANTVFPGMPLVINQDKTFNEALYMQFLDSVTDLRVEAEKMVPTKDELDKAVEKLAKIVPHKMAVTSMVVDRVAEATAGVQPTAIASAPVRPTTMAPAMPAMPTAPATPAAPGGQTSTEAFDVLSSLLNPSK